MCDSCGKLAAEDVGKPMPDVGEFLQAIAARAEVAVDVSLAERGLMLNETAAMVRHTSVIATIKAVGEVMGEEGVIWARPWLAMLGVERWKELQAEEETSG